MTDGDIPADDPYAALGVPRNADVAAIRAAYYALVRVHTPEDDPDGFERVDAAYRALSDPTRRAEVDARLATDPAVSALVARAEAALAARDGRAAVECASELVRAHAASDEALGAAARLLATVGALKSAAAALELLLARNPGDAAARSLLGRIEEVRGRHAEAASHLAAAVDERPDDVAARLARIDALLAAGRLDEAATALDDDVLRSSAEPASGMPVAIRRARLDALRGDAAGLLRNARAFLGSVPREDEAARRAFVGAVVEAASAAGVSPAARCSAARLAVTEYPDDPTAVHLAQSAREELLRTTGLADAIGDLRLEAWQRDVFRLAAENIADGLETSAIDARVQRIARHMGRGRHQDRARRAWGRAAARHPDAAQLAAPCFELVHAHLRPTAEARRETRLVVIGLLAALALWLLPCLIGRLLH